jgi:hypothetical protein
MKLILQEYFLFTTFFGLERRSGTRDARAGVGRQRPLLLSVGEPFDWLLV